MITLCKAKDRRCVRHRKQEIRLTFDPQDRASSFALGIGALEILAEHLLPPGSSIAQQPRPEAEIITYVLKGALAQEDSKGRSGVIRAGEFQRMSAGRLVRHSDRNASQTDWAHVFRMSLCPSESELDCAYEQKRFSVAERRGVLCIVVSPDGRKGSLIIHQDALIYSAVLYVGQHLVHELREERIAWIHVVRGEITLCDLVLNAGDGAGVSAEPAVSLTALEETEILLFDLNGRQVSSKNGAAV